MNDILRRTPDELFGRYRRDGNPTWLAQVFDLVAPELLRVAYHLCGDLSLAEDLLQSTFVVAIESAQDYDERRGLMPWLNGILANRAKDTRRKATYRAGLRPLELRAEPGPDLRAQLAELDSALPAALDELAEPYRQVVLLKLQHDLSPAEIAHLFDRSPGTVRVQLHRGLEMLRKALPRGFAIGALAAMCPTRGLAGIREEVLVKASAARVASSTLLAWGGIIGMKKVVAIVLGFVLLAGVLWTLRAEEGGASGVGPPRSEGGELARMDVVNAGADLAMAPEEESRTAAATVAAVPREEWLPLTGLVLDAGSRSPIAGARIEVYASALLTLREIEALDDPTIVPNLNSGGPRSVGSWPMLVGENDSDNVRVKRTEEELLGWKALRFYDRPAAGSQPLAIGESDALGRYELRIPPSGGMLICTKEGYDERVMPAPEARLDLPVFMAKAQEIRGRLVDSAGVAVRERLTLVFNGSVGPTRKEMLVTLESPGPRRGVWTPKKEHLQGPWVCETAPDGSFTVTVGAERPHPICTTPGWGVASSSESGSPGNSQLDVVVQRVTTLRVRDARHGSPIQDFHAFMHSKGGSLRLSGGFHAASGMLSLRHFPLVAGVSEETYELTVWAEAYRPTCRQIVISPTAEWIDIELEPGSCPSLRGTIIIDGKPSAGAKLSLTPFDHHWSSKSLRPVTGCMGQEDGSYVLSAPAGKYRLRVRAEGRERYLPIDLPQAEPLDIELSALCTLIVQVRDTHGSVRADVMVSLQSEDGEQQWSECNADGVATFDQLGVGMWLAHLKHGAAQTASRPIESAEVELKAGEVRTIVLRVTPDEKRYARVEREDGGSLAGWRGRAEGEKDWVMVAEDGRLTLNLNRHEKIIIAAPGGNEYRYHALPMPVGEEIIRIPAMPHVYRGRLIDRLTGAPLAGVSLGIELDTAGGAFGALRAVSQSDGRFELHVPSDEAATLSFYDDRDWKRQMTFEVLEPPSLAAELELRIFKVKGSQLLPATARMAQLSGRVIDGLTGKAIDGAKVVFSSTFVEESGTLRGRLEGGAMLTGADGRYEVSVPTEADLVEVHAWAARKKDARELIARRRPPAATEAEEWDLIIP